jgi:glycosyltransferase involved in cell wall biosynthesis
MARTLKSFGGVHEGDAILVCGCGQSLNELAAPEGLVIIGVNDVGRLLQPDYLVVVNPRRQFTGDRFRYVESSKARAIFTQLDLGMVHPNVVRFRLGRHGGTEFDDPNVLHYTQNSPYVAVCLAVHMGAKRIGLIGVDFTDHHFFGPTGRHALAGSLERIDREYAALAEALAGRGVELVNLSGKSRLTALRKLNWATFFSAAQREEERFSIVNGSAKPTVRRGVEGRGAMKVAVERHRPGIVGDFMDALACMAQALGHAVTRDVLGNRHREDFLAVVWNGRSHRSAQPTVYCEHGWLPRWDYQVSARGINAQSHLAPFVWDGRPLSPAEADALAQKLAAIRHGGPREHRYMCPSEPPVEDVPEAFILVPLQIEMDTNIQRHAPPSLRRMQAFIDCVAAANPPYPLVIKQHPADTRRGNAHLHLKVRRRQDQIRRHDAGNIHQILRTGGCKFIVSLNSNVVHDGLVWDVPAIVLGDNVWPKKEPGPFMTMLPNDWAEIESFFASESTRQCRAAYARYLMLGQWTLADARSQPKVAELLENAFKQRGVSAGPRQPVPRRHWRRKPLINAVAANRGWLFEDLKRHFARLTREDVEVVGTERARTDAAAWIYLRAHEAADAPDPARTVVQIHDMYDDGLYRPGGKRHAVARCGGVVLTHPRQREILECNGIDCSAKQVLVRPIGALRAFQPRAEIVGGRFRIGWVGRPVIHAGVDLKRVDWLVEAVQNLDLPSDRFEVVFIGERLGKAQERLEQAGIACRYFQRARHPIETYPAHYRELDCVVITSKVAAGPNCLFEALAVGIPVISTPVGWAGELLRDGQNGFLVEDVSGIARSLRNIHDHRVDWYQRRLYIRNSVQAYTVESWIDDNIDLASNLACRQAEVPLAAFETRLGEDPRLPR